MCEWGYLIHHTDSISNVGKDGLSMRGGQNSERWRSDCFITAPAISWLLCSYKCTLGCLTGKSSTGHQTARPWPAATLGSVVSRGPGDTPRRPGSWSTQAFTPCGPHGSLQRPAPARCSFLQHLPTTCFPNSQQHSDSPRKKRTVVTDPHAFSSVPHRARYPVGLAV